ncbi:MAG: type II toxin-antitoxin system HicB family antitoxin [bacterium]|jgi:antitoxin HicB
MIHKYTVIYEPAEEGGYIVHIPALPGCVTQGDTLEEAREMAKDAIRGYLEMLAKHGEEIPVEPTGTVHETVSVSLPPAV